MKNKIKFFDKHFFVKLINKSKTKIAEKLLFFLSFLESIIFPIPVDPLLAVLVINNPEKLLRLTIICTLASVIGGTFGWYLGFIMGNEVEKLFNILPWMNDKSFNEVRNSFNSHGILIVFLGAFTPLPFKIIAITSGIFNVNIIGFLLMSFFGRGLRFFLVSFVVKKYGAYGMYILKNKFLMITSIVGIILIILYTSIL